VKKLVGNVSVGGYDLVSGFLNSLSSFKTAQTGPDSITSQFLKFDSNSTPVKPMFHASHAVGLSSRSCSLLPCPFKICLLNLLSKISFIHPVDVSISILKNLFSMLLFEILISLLNADGF